MSFDTLILAPFSQDGLAVLESLGRVTYEPWTKTQTLYDPEELGLRLAREGYQGLVVEADFLFEEVFSTPSSLRFAAICRAALNQVDLDAATERGVAVVNTPGRNAQAVAELVLAMVLDLARLIPPALRYLLAGEWQEPTEPYVRFQGREIAGATLGIIGLGEIGKRVATIAQSMGMRVLAHDPYVPIGASLPSGTQLVSLHDLLRQSDFVSVHVPDVPQTAGLLDEECLSIMLPGASLINVTSPGIVDQRALRDALESGRLWGAALDVHDSHPLPPDSPLLALARAGYNVVLTPHIGGATHETVDRYSRMVTEDIQQFLCGQRPKHLANPDVWQRLRSS